MTSTTEPTTTPELRILSNSVGFTLHRQYDSGTYGVAAAGEVDRFGHISLRRMTPHMAATLAEYEARQQERHEEMTEALLDAGLAEMRAVGSGDSELYATQELLRRLAPALAALPRGWQRWP